MKSVTCMRSWVAVHSPIIVICIGAIVAVLALQPWRLAYPSVEDAALTVAALGLVLVGLNDRRQERERRETVASSKRDTQRERHERVRASIGVWVGALGQYDTTDRHFDGLMAVYLKHEGGERAEHVDCVGYPNSSAAPVQFEGHQDVLAPGDFQEQGPPGGWAFKVYHSDVIDGAVWRLVLSYGDRLGGCWETEGTLTITDAMIVPARYTVSPRLRVDMGVPRPTILPDLTS